MKHERRKHMITIQDGIVSMSEFEYFNLRLIGTDNATISNSGVNIKSNDVEITVTNYLHVRGFRRNNLGFGYVRKAILICLENPMAINSIILLYQNVAMSVNSTQSRVERAIRHSIEVAMRNNKVKNSEFIARAAEEIRMERG
jgi:two-component system response regulator (stage 0 sporulation protein A)